MNRSLALVFLVTTLLMGAACSSSDGGDEPTPSPTPEVTLTGIHAELAELMDDAAMLTFRVVLERTAPPEDAGNRLVITSTPSATRVDTIPAGGNEPVTSIIEAAGEDKAISCQDGPDNWQCSSSGGFERGVLRTASPFTFFPAYVLETYGVEETESRTIAGEASTCYLIEPPDEDVLEYCFSPAGVPVYSSPVFGTYEAIELDSTVSDDAFEPPANVD